MPWLPLGPDFVFGPKSRNFKRLSRRNEAGRQARVTHIAVSPDDERRIYIITNPVSDGWCAFRTDNGGASWKNILKDIQDRSPATFLTRIAVHPLSSNRIYGGTAWRGLYVSDNYGDTWTNSGFGNGIFGNFRKLWVDPANATDYAITHLYACTDYGFYRSVTGGATWSLIFPGQVNDFCVIRHPDGTYEYFINLSAAGVFLATDLSVAHPTLPGTTGNWVNLNTAGGPIPAYNSTTFPANNAKIDYCPNNTRRVYIWYTEPNKTIAIYTRDPGTRAWSRVATNSIEGIGAPAYGYYCYRFAVAPNSPGDNEGRDDVLFLTGNNVIRSINGGRDFEPEGIRSHFLVPMHGDQHFFTFFPERPAIDPARSTPGRTVYQVPRFYGGNDGGVCRSEKYCDQRYGFSATTPVDALDIRDADQNMVNAGTEAPSNTGMCENLNHRLYSTAIYLNGASYCSPAGYPSLSYLGLQDTGFAAGSGRLGWRSIRNSDGACVLAYPGNDGMHLYILDGDHGGFESFRISSGIDTGRYGIDFRGGASIGGAPAQANGRPALMTNNSCLLGGSFRNNLLTLTSAANASPVPGMTGVFDIVDINFPSLTGISVGVVLWFGTGLNEERVIVRRVDTSADTVGVRLTKNHSAPVTVRIEPKYVMRLDWPNTTTILTRNLIGYPWTIRQNPRNLDEAYVSTQPEERGLGLFHLFKGNNVRGSSATSWTEVTGLPTTEKIMDMQFAADGTLYILYMSPQPSADMSFSSPLYRIRSGTVEHLRPENLPMLTDWDPSGQVPYPYRHMVIHPNAIGGVRLYISHSYKIYEVRNEPSTSLPGINTWRFRDISNNLPKHYIYNLWIGRAGATTLLRTTIPAMGAYELDVDNPNNMDTPYLYMRDNILDSGWVLPSPSGTHPYEPATQVFHYHCADIKVDAAQNGTDSSGRPTLFFQTDGEGIPPISAIDTLSYDLFHQLRDNSQNLPSGGRAKVHVLVNNRSNTPTSNVKVWLLRCNAAGMVPSLNQRTGMAPYNFFDQFTSGFATGTLPAGSPWTNLGMRTLDNITAAEPKVATFDITIPTLAPDDSGHYCLVAFVHSADLPIRNYFVSASVDEMTARNPQVGQKNLHIVRTLPPTPPEGGWIGGETHGGPAGRPPVIEYVHFHNPFGEVQQTTLIFDFSRLPANIRAALRFWEIGSVRPINASITNIDRMEDYESPAAPGAGIFILIRFWIINLIRSLLGKRAIMPAKQKTAWQPYLFRARPSALVEVPDIILPAYGKCVAAIVLTTDGDLDKGETYSFEVQQTMFKKGSDPLTGGSTYIVKIEGEIAIPVGERREREKNTYYAPGFEEVHLNKINPEWFNGTGELLKRSEEESRSKN
jgi:hypothetical protein